MKISTKLIISFLSVSIASTLIIATLLIIKMNSRSSETLEEINTLLFSNYDRNIRTEIETATSMLNALVKQRDAGKITDAQMRQLSADLLRDLRYDKDGYFWADTPEGLNIVLYGSAAEGKNRFNQQDAKGKFLVQEIIANGMKDDGGFTDYYFPRKGETVAKPKRGYSLYNKSLGWIIGTGNYIDDIDKKINDARAVLLVQMRKDIITVLLITSLLIAVSIAVGVYLSRKITAPIANLQKSLEGISRLDFSSDNTTDSYAKLQNEIGSISRSIINMRESVKEVARKIINVSEQVSEKSNLLNEVTVSLTQAVHSQAASSEEISATIEELLASLVQNADMAVDASSLVEKSHTVSAKGSEVLGDAIISINEINESSKKIGEIISVINDISFQTNLLALNAAVEAARAGEQGRGFAVVAGEVRNLAQRSATSAKEIETLIKSSTEKVDKGTRYVNDSGQFLKEILGSIGKIKDLVGDINNATQEQKLGLQQISSAIMMSDKVAQQNAASADELTGAAKELNSCSGDLKDTIGVFKL